MVEGIGSKRDLIRESSIAHLNDNYSTYLSVMISSLKGEAIHVLSLLRCPTTESSLPEYMMTATLFAVAFVASSEKNATGLNYVVSVVSVAVTLDQMAYSRPNEREGLKTK